MDGVLLGFQDGEGLWRRSFRYGNGSPGSGSSCETYAKLPSWHVEDVASLAAALIPRQNFHLKFHPIHGVPGEPKPYEHAKTWGALLDETEPVGRAISLLARARGLSDWGFSGSDLYVDPAEFVEFCTAPQFL